MPNATHRDFGKATLGLWSLQCPCNWDIGPSPGCHKAFVYSGCRWAELTSR